MSGVTTRELSLAALLTALIAASAYISIPLGPVPFTLQVAFVLLAGLVLGPRLAALAIAAYLCLGLIAPVFAGGTSGISVLLGPTAGYLWGFLPAAIVAGWLGGGRASLSALVSACLAGLLPLYLLGASWLAVQQHLSLSVAFAIGVVQFLPLDVAKAVAAGVTARSLVSLPLGLPGLQGR